MTVLRKNDYCIKFCQPAKLVLIYQFVLKEVLKVENKNLLITKQRKEIIMSEFI